MSASGSAQIPLANPGDTVERLDERPCPVRRDPDRREVLYAVVHRGAGLWTHLYRVVLAAASRPEIHLDRVLEGDRLAELRRVYGRVADLAA
ncbi:hypothetical protein FFK22_034465 [Mycobacterium sp. KBS0706]|uniref:hypothetical protein n=1 Tax=Mycobacterium sp. KBS0706 TaxID=2578109 RepID=UPI00110FC9DE|nr:hypothetical protein [Mycobacterium sp. KBS0706]TSD84068.1 hypothetical protein FFK22_034465 [Mycobacterium sp. KBS0706]